MRFSSVSRLACVCTVLLAAALSTFAEPPSAKLNDLLPNEVGPFHQLPSMRPLVDLARDGILKPEMFRPFDPPGGLPFLGGQADYLSQDGEKLKVELLKFNGESDAYSFLTLLAERAREVDPGARLKQGEVGTVSVQSQKSVAFFKGTTVVRITNGKASSKKSEIALARLFADRIDKGEAEVPVLLKHLPSWESASENAIYLVSLEGLKLHVGDQQILDAVSFEGGTEAVAAKYGPSQLVLVEFTTPQLAGDNDRRIIEKIHELWQQGKPSPTGYRRVGNYSVFVFNAANEQAANQLIDQVKYEQVVQWLGDNPNWLKEAQRRYTETMLGTFVGVIKTSGLAAVLCFGVGGFFGALLFFKRRAEHRAYSDAGGMMRLNLDEMTAEPDARKLVGPGIPDKT